jgi:hypothetical protein
MLRCPTCLNRLVDGEAKRCPECGSRVNSRRRHAVPDDLITQRPRALVERELQARIEAQTAEHFLERRRAAKAARRIAALPPSLWEAGSMIDDPVTWNAAPSIVIDLPASAFRDIKPEPAPVVVPVEREPIALVAPVMDLPSSDIAVDDHEPDAADGSPRRPWLLATTIERWRVRRIQRYEVDDEDGDENGNGAHPEPEPVAVEEPEPVVVEEPEPVVVLEPEPEPVVATEPEPRIVPEPEPEPVVVREPEPEPVVLDDEPEEAVAAVAFREPEPERVPARAEPRGAVEWEPSNSLWSSRVFNPRGQPVRYASWPRPPKPHDDLARDYIDAQVRDQ